MKIIKFISLPVITALFLAVLGVSVKSLIAAAAIAEVVSYTLLFFKFKYAEGFDAMSVWGMLVSQYTNVENVNFFDMTHLFGARFLSYLLMWFGVTTVFWWVGLIGILLFLSTTI